MTPIEISIPCINPNCAGARLSMSGGIWYADCPRCRIPFIKNRHLSMLMNRWYIYGMPWLIIVFSEESQ